MDAMPLEVATLSLFAVMQYKFAVFAQTQDVFL
jgi:hypothetical protein